MNVFSEILLPAFLVMTLSFIIGLQVLFRERRAKRLLLKEKEVMFNYVHDVGEVFAEADSVDLDPLLERALYYALRTTRASAGVVYLFDSTDLELCARAVAGVMPPLARETEILWENTSNRSQYLDRLLRAQRIHKGEGLIGQIAEKGMAQLTPDAERDPRIPYYADELLQIRSLLAVPMRFGHLVMGVMVVVNPVDGDPFVESDMSLLQALADQASVSAHFVMLREELDAKRRIDYDLAIARRIQTSLLPRQLPDYPGIELAAYNIPALGVGGDYYDIVRIDDQHMGVAIADVSGKGVSGAILMSVCRSVLRARAPGCTSPRETLRALNRAMSEDLADDMFVTAAYLVLNLQTREVTFARAGHEPPWLWRAGAAKPELLESDGIALGMGSPEAFDEWITESSVTLQPGDALILLTDGIFEAQNTDEEEWGIERLEATLKSVSEKPLAGMLDTVRVRLMEFVGNAKPYDDMTMVALRISKDSVPGSPGSV